MTSLVYTSCSAQRCLSLSGAMEVGLEISRSLESNPVLKQSVVSVSNSGTARLISVQASVQADAHSKLSLVIALAAADEQWLQALGWAECEKATTHSQLRRQGTPC